MNRIMVITTMVAISRAVTVAVVTVAVVTVAVVVLVEVVRIVCLINLDAPLLLRFLQPAYHQHLNQLN